MVVILYSNDPFGFVAFTGREQVTFPLGKVNMIKLSPQGSGQELFSARWGEWWSLAECQGAFFLAFSPAQNRVSPARHRANKLCFSIK